MRLLILSLFLIVQILGSKTCNAQGVGTFQWTNGAPNNNPGLSGAKFAVDKNTYRWYEWVSGTSWVESGDRIQRISGCSAPAYTPTIHNAYFVVNGCTSPEFYFWNGTAWKLLNGGATYTAGGGISIVGTVISNTGLLTGTAFAGDVSGAYNNLQIGAGVVGSNEIANASIVGGDISWPLLAPNGSVSAPSYSFSGNASGGLYRASKLVSLVAGADNTLTLRSGAGRGVNILSDNNAAGASGAVSINTGTSTGDISGAVSINTGVGTLGSGAINIFSSDIASGTPGIIEIRAASNANGAGADIATFAGNGTTAGGESKSFAGAASGVGAVGGRYQLNGGASSGAGGIGGRSELKGGPGEFGGDVLLTGGLGASHNKGGKIIATGIGIVFPILTTSQRDALTGLTGGHVIWNSTLLKLQVYNGTTWENLH